MDHVRMQAAAQKWVDLSISKTINCPEDIFDAFKDVYMAAWDQGCKGCTTYRPNAVTGSVLTVSETSGDAGRSGAQVRGNRRMARWSICPSRWTGRRRWRGDLQAEMARQRTCHLHHHQRHRPGRPPPPVRGLHQLQEHGALCLDGGADG
jgi:ribonucleotide reductase alpha subunit